MSIANTWHLWHCDGCDAEVNLAHGQWAEPETPHGWRATMGRGLHACSAACQEKVQQKHQDAKGRLFLWFDADNRNPPPPAREFAPLPPPTTAAPAPGVFG